MAAPRSLRGFTLIEVMIAMVIAMILMAVLAGLFSQSVKTRTQVQRDGQKIENARYSLDVLAEDIRLAGYWGTYAPATTGSSPADWKYASPCSTASTLPGWNPATSPAQVPFPIFGYEAHNADGTAAALPVGLTGCLPDYLTGTDVLVVRRASTTAVTLPTTALVAGDPYLQVSSCGDGTVDTAPFIAAVAADTSGSNFNLHKLGCTAATPGANPPVRRLITRIYYVASCNLCDGDSTPTLKMVELGMNGGALRLAENVVTIAPGVENLHLEYGIDTNDDGATDDYVLSNNDPHNGTSGTPVGGMRVDGAGENRWEDVVSVKVWVVVRDLEATPGYTDNREYVLGERTQAAAGDGFKRKVSFSSIKVVNMSGRREQP